jgi:hypothetical protein
MDRDWILQTRETRRTLAASTWIPLRESFTEDQGDARHVGYVSEYFGCGSVAFAEEHREIAERLGWSEIGTGRNIRPYAYEDGYYASIEQYQYNDKEPVGINLVFDWPQPVVGGNLWTLSPDLVVALRLIKEGNCWVRPEEDFVVVAREFFDKDGNHRLIEIKREFLIDYLAARNLSLRLAYFRQRVENVPALAGSAYAGLEDHQEQRSGGDFELLIRNLNDVYGGTWAMFRAWRTDVDEEDDAPVMGPEGNDNTGFESTRGYRGGYDGVRIESEFYKQEWIEHQTRSVRVRGDADPNLPHFIAETDGTRIPSAKLNYEEIGRWLWFRPSVITELLNHRGFSLRWHTAETGSIDSTSGYSTHFGINSSELITVYAYDIARLAPWEQHIWAAHNIAPDGKVSGELLAAQVKSDPASTHAVEDLFFKSMELLELHFRREFNVALFAHDLDQHAAVQQISRFASRDQASLLRLAKDLVRVFTDRLDMRELRKLSDHPDKEKLGSNKLLQGILAKKVGVEKAREVFGPIVGVYDMRVGDAHPTSSKIGEAIKLAGINEDVSYLRKGEQLIHNVGKAIWLIGLSLFGDKDS